jgi:hypothetical protein
MVLTKDELIASLQSEVRILLHLAGKIDRNQLDYRPTPKQRSTIELLRYLTIMGPELILAIKAGTFDWAVWQASLDAANRLDFDQTLAAIGNQTKGYAELIGQFSEDELRSEVEMLLFPKSSRGALIVNLVLCGCAAYRTQLFLYLKACGRDELGTTNLWAGVDAAAPAGA